MGFWTFVTIMVLVGLAKSVMKHRQQMAEMGRLRREDGGSLAGELGQLRVELAELRDTATSYDLSFDTALQGIASRVARLEQRMDRAEVGAAPRVEVG